MTVWARTSDPTEFHVRYGTSESELDQVSPAGTTRIENDNTGTTTLVDLEADQRYFYQVYLNDRPHGLPGSFLTLPAANEVKSEEHNPDGLFNFRFQIGSCANQNPIHGNGHRAKTYEHLNQDWANKTHFHIMNGDWLYEELREHPPEAWRLRAGIDQLPRNVELMPTMVGVWENYKLYLSRDIPCRSGTVCPSYFTFDDQNWSTTSETAPPDAGIVAPSFATSAPTLSTTISAGPTRPSFLTFMSPVPR